MAQSSREVTYTFHDSSIEYCVFSPGSFDVVGSLSNYFLLMIGVCISELGDAPFQEAHMFVSQLNFLARVTLLF